MCIFLQHDAQNSSTWMTSCMQFENIEGYSFGTANLEGCWRSVA